MIERYSDHAANERTFLAWVRTAIAIMAFGFLVEKFDLFLEIAGRSSVGRMLSVGGQNYTLSQIKKISRTRNECATRMMAPMLNGFLARHTATEKSLRRGASSARISSVLSPNGGTFTAA